MAEAESAYQLAQTISKLRKQDPKELSNYQKALLEWSKNVDRRYAWVLLFTLWLILFATLGPFKIYGLIYAKVTADGYYTREEASWPVFMILTLENLIGVAAIFIHYISIRQSMFIGGLLLVAGNGLSTFSSNIIVDTLLLGVVQGMGFGFIFMPFMEAINNYFLKYRNVAFGVSLCGGTLSVFVLGPLFQWLLKEYPWRYSYLAMGAICSIIPLAALLLKPNPRPSKSTIEEREIEEKPVDKATNIFENMNKMDFSLIWSIMRIPAFHLIWFNELVFFWVSSIFILVQVDYALDHGCNQQEAEFLLQFQSIGEIIGRIILTYLVDIGGLRHQKVVAITFFALGLALIAITQVTGYILMAVTSATIAATYSLLYVLLNGLLVEHLGEGQVTLGYGLASFICGVLMIFRPQAVGYFRDNLGSYDPLMFCLAGSCGIAALLWIFEPFMPKIKRQNAQGS